MRRHHHPVSRLLAHTENGFEDHDDELAWRIVVVEKKNLVELGLIQLQLDLRFRLYGNVVVTHRKIHPLMT